MSKKGQGCAHSKRETGGFQNLRLGKRQRGGLRYLLGFDPHSVIGSGQRKTTPGARF